MEKPWYFIGMYIIKVFTRQVTIPTEYEYLIVNSIKGKDYSKDEWEQRNDHVCREVHMHMHMKVLPSPLANVIL